MNPNKHKHLGWILLAMVAALIALGYLTYLAMSSYVENPEQFYAQISALGVWGPAVIVVLLTVQVLMGPVPGQLIGMASGYLYGVVWGTLLSLLGLGIGSWLAMWLARRLGRPLVLRVAKPETIERIDDLSQRYGMLGFFLVFLLPIFPTDVGCYVAGLTPLPIPILVILAIIGRLPGVFVLNWVGATSHSLGGWGIAAIIVITILGALLTMRYHVQLQQATIALMRRLGMADPGEG